MIKYLGKKQSKIIASTLKKKKKACPFLPLPFIIHCGFSNTTTTKLD